MTGPVPALPAALDTSDFDPDGDDHWRLQSGHLYRSRLIEDQSDSVHAGLFTYEGRKDGTAYFTRRTGASLYTFALPPAQLEQAFHFPRLGEHNAPVPVNPLTAPMGTLSALRGPERPAEGPQGVPGTPGQAPPAHEPVDTSGVTLSRTR